MRHEMYEHIYQVEQTHWWYVGRRKIIFDWILRLLGDQTASCVLDIGCGTGFNLEYLEALGYERVVGLDFSSEALAFCQQRSLSRLVCGDGAQLPLQGGVFDVILALDMIEHVDDDVQALEEFARVLKPEGSLILFCPALNWLWGLQDEVSHHRRRYTSRDLGAKLEAAGLCADKLTFANTFLFPLVLAGRLLWRLLGDRFQVTSENDLHPRWSNRLLSSIFAAEGLLLRHVNLPIGVSLFCVARKKQAALTNGDWREGV